MGKMGRMCNMESGVSPDTMVAEQAICLRMAKGHAIFSDAGRAIFWAQFYFQPVAIVMWFTYNRAKIAISVGKMMTKEMSHADGNRSQDAQFC
jgi:hypothetical protein